MSKPAEGTFRFKAEGFDRDRGLDGREQAITAMYKKTKASTHKELLFVRTSHYVSGFPAGIMRFLTMVPSESINC
jgi:hypothetical protein